MQSVDAGGLRFFRAALGALLALAVVRYFLVENWIVTTTGLTIGVALTVGLNALLANVADVARIDPTLIAVGVLLLWGVGLLAALAPAIRATAVAPVVATKSA